MRKPSFTALLDLLDRLGPTQRKLLRLVGYPLFAVFCFLIFLVLTFPLDPVKSRVISYAEKELKLQIDIGKLSTSLPLGIKAKNVTIRSKDEQDPLLPIPLNVAYARLNVNLLPLLFGRQSVGFSVETLGGDLDGSITLDKKNERYELDLDIDKIKFEEAPPIKGKFKTLPIKGAFSLKGDVQLDFKEPAKSSGTLGLKIVDGVVGPGKYGAEIPLLKAGTIDAHFKMANNVLELDKYQQNSPDMQSDGIGTITFQKEFASTRVNIDWRFRFVEDFLKKNDVVRMLLAAAQPALGGDKYYYYNLRGPLKNVQPVPNRAAQSRFKGKGGGGGQAAPDTAAKPARNGMPNTPRPDNITQGKGAMPKLPEMAGPPPAVPPTPPAPTPPPSASPPPSAGTITLPGPKTGRGGIREVKDEAGSEPPEEAAPPEEGQGGENTDTTDEQPRGRGGRSRRSGPANDDNTDSNGNDNGEENR